MLTVLEKEAIRKAYFRDRESMREIARERGHSWRTVKKSVEDPSPSRYRRTKPPASPVLGPFIALIEEMLTTDRTRPRKQRHTARRVWKRLVDEHGFGGDESTVRRYVRWWKREHGVEQPDVTAVIEHPPGEEAQVDWGQVYWLQDGVQRLGHLFEMTLPFSQARFARVYPFEKQEAFFDGHLRAFDFFEGIADVLRYDNLMTAVKKVLRGRERIEQDTFIHFRSHCGFDSSFCTPAKGNEKGAVEGNIGYCRRNWFVPLPEFHSLDDLNAWLLTKCREELQRTPAGRTISIGEALVEERARLEPLPRIPYDACRVVLAKANHQALVRFEGSRYSVPVSCAFRDVTVRAYVDRVVLCVEEREVARHPRALTPESLVQDPEHFLGLLERKPALLDHARVFRGLKLPEVFLRFREVLAKEGSPEARDRALRGTARLLALAGTKGWGVVTDALDQEMQASLRDARLPSADAVLMRIAREASAWKGSDAAPLSSAPRIEVPTQSLEPYQKLVSRAGSGASCVAERR